jgi:glycogen synthase
MDCSSILKIPATLLGPSSNCLPILTGDRCYAKTVEQFTWEGVANNFSVTRSLNTDTSYISCLSDANHLLGRDGGSHRSAIRGFQSEEKILKILIVSNLYPPHYVGGYELRCAQVAAHLLRAGHEVRVLTSSYRLPIVGQVMPEPNPGRVTGISVERSLHHFRLDPLPSGCSYTLSMAKRQMADARRFVQILDEFRPDIVNWWNLEGLTKTILPIPARRGTPDVHWVEDCWMIREYGLHGENEHLSWFKFWRGDWGPLALRSAMRRTLASLERRVKRRGIPTCPFPNRPHHVCFVSKFMQVQHLMSGLRFPSSEVIHGGISLELFYSRRASVDFEKGKLRFLYAGQIDRSRGLHTIIEALGLLPQDARESIQLSIACSGPPEPDKYFDEITRKIQQQGLSNAVNFVGKIQHEHMPRLYREHHVLISASSRGEGLPLTMMEAMCAGCAVMTTGSGGALEIADLADLPIFPSGDPLALSRLMAKLAEDRELAYQIGCRGQETAKCKFTSTRMMEQLSRVFQRLYDEKIATAPNWHGAFQASARS